MFRLTQSAAPLTAIADECHLLEAIEGQPAFARLSSSRHPGLEPGSRFLPAEEEGSGAPAQGRGDGGEYELELVTDTGPASEPYGIIMLVAFDVPADRTEEVDRWYDEEHIRLLMQSDGWLRARRFRVGDHRGKRWTSMAFHELRDIGVMDSEGRRVARSTPWRAELEREDWFRAAGRWVFQPVGG